MLRLSLSRASSASPISPSQLVRLYSSTPPTHAAATSITRFNRSYSFTSAPSPPKLPSAQQAEFERLQRQAAAPTAAPTAAAPSEGKEVNAGLYRGAPPEFEGDRNPKTGEVGGPKKEPLRWGGGGDWSYNGRVTDF